MELTQLYADIMKRGTDAILLGREQIDDFIDDDTDTRMGLTLVIRPPHEIKERMVSAIKRLEHAEPGQYYYPMTDFHITLFDIITATQGFLYTSEQKENSIALAKVVLAQASSFDIQLKGMLLSEGCIMVKGFYPKEMEKIRQQLRAHITEFGLTLDERYPTMSSHITVGRFRKPLSHREMLLRQIGELAEYDFGTFTVSEVELVCHNWYDSKKEVIERFYI